MPIAAIALFAIFFDTAIAATATMAAAVSIPIIIHLLNRKRFRIVVWAAMRFLLAAQKQNARRLRIEQLILLAVRTALILFLVLGMLSVMPWAEDVWHKLFPENVALASPSNLRTHKILVIDGSFSMAAKVDDTTCFEKARGLAEQVIRESHGGDAFSLVLMASPPRRIVSMASEDAPKVTAEIQGLRLPHGNADLAATLNAVEDLLRQSPSKFEDREVYFLTDVQHSTWLNRRSTMTAVIQKIQARARTIFLDVGKDGIANSAVTSLTLGAPLATTGVLTPITATIHNFTPTTREQARVELWVGKARQTAAEQSTDLRLVAQAAARLARGENTVSFQHKFLTPGEYAVQVRVESDALDLDDVRTAIVSVKSGVPVMLVNGKQAADPFDRAAEWVRLALNPYEGTQAPSNVPARPKMLSESQFADAGLGDLTPFDCVFLCDVPRLSAAEVKRLESHVRSGGGVVVSLGDQADLASYNEVLFKNGAGLLPARLVSKQRAPAGYFFHLAVDGQSYELPPLSAFAEQNDRDSLLTARFRQYVRTEIPGKSPARKVLSFVPGAAARSADTEKLPVGDGALIEWQPLLATEKEAKEGVKQAARLRGRVVLVPTTLNMDWTSWPASRSFLPMMQELLRFAVSGRLREQASLVGEGFEEFLQTNATGLEATVVGPGGRSETVRVENGEDASVFRYAGADFSGVYRVTIGQHPQEHLFAVNVPASGDGQQAGESDLTRANKEQLQKAYPDWDLQIVTNTRDVVRTVNASSSTAEAIFRPLGPAVARWLLLAVLVLVLTEVILAWHFGHYTAVAGAPGGAPKRGMVVPLAIAALAAAVLLPTAGILAHAAWTGDFLGFLPENSRRSVEQALGVPAPAEGEGSRWRLEFASYLWDAAADPWLAGFLVLAGGGLVTWIYFHEGRTASRWYRVLMGGLRISLVLVVLCILLPQLKLWFERQGWPDVAVIIDDSQSMSAVDRYRDADVQAAADQLIPPGSMTKQERLQLAQALLTQRNGEWLRKLLSDRRVKVHVYHCSHRASRINEISGADQIDVTAKQIQELRADSKNDSSQLGAAVRQVLNDFRGASLSALVMLTDGVTTEGEDLAKVSRYASQVGVPLYFVGIGDSHEQRDLELNDLQVEDAVYVNDRVVFEARLTAHGYPEKMVEVQLREKGKEGVLSTQMVKTDAQGKPTRIRMIHQPREAGEKIYVMEVKPEADEAQSDNNSLERAVSVREAKLIKVLYVEGTARYEYRFIKTLLERESDKAKGNKSIDLKVLLLDADPDYATQDRSALPDFPSKPQLQQFDVVILGDVDPRADSKMVENMRNLADFVKERGGGLLMIGGERFAPHVYKDTPLADVLPIEVTANRQPDEPESGRVIGYRPELTPAGKLHPIFRFSPDEKESESVWNRLREMFWWSEGYIPKRAAEVLAVHPKQRASVPAEGLGLSGHPLVVQQFVGAGRCMFFGFNETWRWRWREDELRFNQFWVQTVRYLARSRVGKIDLRLDRQTPYRRGEPIKILVRFPDDAPPPGADTDVKVVVERRSPHAAESESQTVQLTKMEGSRATFEGLLTRTPEGEYRFTLTSPTVPGVKPHAECRVLAPPGEMDRLRMNQPEMERAAEETHGKFYTLAQAGQLLDDLPAGARVTVSAPGPPLLLWNHAAIFAFTLFLLTAEWILRKRKHLL